MKAVCIMKDYAAETRRTLIVGVDRSFKKRLIKFLRSIRGGSLARQRARVNALLRSDNRNNLCNNWFEQGLNRYDGGQPL